MVSDPAVSPTARMLTCHDCMAMRNCFQPTSCPNGTRYCLTTWNSESLPLSLGGWGGWAVLGTSRTRGRACGANPGAGVSTGAALTQAPPPEVGSIGRGMGIRAQEMPPWCGHTASDLGPVARKGEGGGTGPRLWLCTEPSGRPCEPGGSCQQAGRPKGRSNSQPLLCSTGLPSQKTLVIKSCAYTCPGYQESLSQSRASCCNTDVCNGSAHHSGFWGLLALSLGVAILCT